MRREVISKETRENLEILKKASLLEDFYLAGGTGLALQLKHRLSFDLDFFTSKEINTKTLVKKLKRAGTISIEREAEDTLTCVFNKTRLTFLRYDYPLLFALKKIEEVKVAQSKDIGCMKIDAISSRGTKKDFIDVFFLCQTTISLKGLLTLFKKKYKDIDYNMLHILKSLVYFDDADKDPMPMTLIPVSWEEVKNFFRKEIKI